MTTDYLDYIYSIEETYTKNGITYGKDKDGIIYEYVEYDEYIDYLGQVKTYCTWKILDKTIEQ